MKHWKWLYPGLKLKRWLGMVMLGIFVISLGTTVLFNARLLVRLEEKLLYFLRNYLEGYDLILGIILILSGLYLIGVGMQRAVRSVISALNPEQLTNLVDKVYQTRSLEKGPKIVVVGGGTGLSTLLRGLKLYSSNITAIVTVSDDGGSSGRIREELGILPPGDIRNTLVGLADTEPLMESLFQYRFSWGKGLTGHSFGNLFIAAMTDITGDFEKAIKEFSKVLAVKGRVIPSTLEPVILKAKYIDGSEAVGESTIPQSGKKIESIFLEPSNVCAVPDAIKAIMEANMIVLGPGSLYTSIIPNILIRQITKALEQTSALKAFVCNIMTQPGETDHMSASEHLEALLNHAENKKIVDYMFINSAQISSVAARRYEKEDAYPITADLERVKQFGVIPIFSPLVSEVDFVRHDPEKLAQAMMELTKYNGELG